MEKNSVLSEFQDYSNVSVASPRHYSLTKDYLLMNRHRKFSHGLFKLFHKVRCIIRHALAPPYIAQLLRKVDVFHCSDLVLLTKRNLKSVVTFHDIAPLLFPEFSTREIKYYLNNKIDFAKKKADAIIAVSKSTKSDLVNYLKLPEDKIKIIYNAPRPQISICPKNIINEYLVRLGIKPEYIFSVGAIEPRKNIITLIKAFEIFKTRGYNYQLVLAGPLGWNYEGILDAIRKSKYNEDIKLLGCMDDEALSAVYSGAAFFVYPSFYEGFGMPPLEAMACGVPVITSCTSSMKELYNETALLIDPNNHEELLERMVDLAVNPGLREELIQKGRLFISEKKFSWEKVACDTINLYKEIIN
jgi:glycosyltransferase involved in cell wall biosynthesis